jgi:serine/threonine protein kinase
MIGRTISHYRIEEKLGEGGMGVVYRARDLSLMRSVAIKFLSSDVTTEERRHRFQQEAQTASSLNHPQILSVYEAGTENGQQYLVTEYVDGFTLRDWARRERPSVRQIVEVMIGIADALACAHQAGIIHRDIKPENILIARQGYAKLADFGLAKLLEAQTGSDEGTRTAVATRAGAILGSVPYMSPEQATGMPVDARTDVFSLGTVLYELLAGQRPFVGTSDPDVLHAILHAPPRPLAEVRPDAPDDLRLAVEKALEKDPADRYQSMRDLVVDLRRVLRRKAPDAVATPVPRLPSRRRGWALAAAAVALVSAVALWQRQRGDAQWQNPLVNARFERLTDFDGSELDAAISADGKFVVFLSDRDGPFDAFVSQVGSGDFLNLTKGQTPELLNEMVSNVGFSGDGAHVWTRVGEFFSPGKPVPERLWLIPTMGGAARLFLDSAVTAAWSPDGSKVAYHQATPGDPIYIADRNGSNPRLIFVDRPGGHCHFLTWSPDARFLYFVRGFPLNEMDVWRVPTTGGEPERISHHNSRVAYPVLLNERTLIYIATADDGTGPWLYSMDLERRVAHRVNVSVERYISIAASAESPGRPRRLVATVSNPSVHLWTVPIADGIVDESAARRFAVPTARSAGPRFGPDYLVYLASRGDADGLWKFKDGRATELWRATDGAVVGAAAVSTDGRQVCFPVRRQGHTTAYCTTADGTNPRELAQPVDVRGPFSWSPDGKWIAVTAGQFDGARLFKVPVDGGPPVRLVDTFASNPVWSPDGAFILYSGPQIGRNVPVKAVTPEGQPYPLPDLWVYRTGENYRFLPGGQQLVLMQGGFRRQNFSLFDLKTGRQRQLTNLQPGSSLRSFDVSADGKSILFDRVRENSDIVLIELPGR